MKVQEYYQVVGGKICNECGRRRVRVNNQGMGGRVCDEREADENARVDECESVRQCMRERELKMHELMSIEWEPKYVKTNERTVDE